MKKQLLAGAFLLACMQLAAQTQSLGQPVSWKGKVLISKKTIALPVINNQAEQTAEFARRAATQEKDLRYGVEQAVNADFMQEAAVQVLPNGDVLRQLTIKSPGAISINMVFSQFELAKGSRLYLFNNDQTEYIGAHTSLNNNANKALGTELIHDDVVTIELTEPAAVAGTSTLVLGHIVHGFLDLETEMAKALNGSGSCEYDVNCPIGAGWENQRNAVAIMMNGSGGFCTGSLLNNTSGTIIPYFLSAAHCGTNPTTWVFRFRWESPAGQADCATSAPSVNGPTTMNVNGGTLRASGTNSDFTLTELNSAPDPAWGVYYNGWDRTENFSPGATAIHHPAGDVKKISFENTTLISTTFGSCPPNSHWGVTSWDQGVTEGGSSGSPLFDVNHRTIGQLHGGASVCGGSSLSDEYGKVSVSWTGGGTNSSRLSNWLDPGNTGVTFVDGVDPAGPGVTVDAALNTPSGVSGTVCSASVTPQVTILNSGSNPLTAATITYGFDGNYTLVYNWTGSLNQYQTQVVTLPAAAMAGGAHTFQATVSNPNGSTDGNLTNNVTTSSFTTIVNGETADLALTIDCYGSETTWELIDTTSETVVYSGGPYQDDMGGTVITQSFCLSGACYQFVIYDEWNDGMTSSDCASGSYTIENADNVQIAGLTQAQANFGGENTQLFCLIDYTGLSELNDLQRLWSVYPNPAENILNIDMSAIEGAKSLIIRNTTGQLVRSAETSGAQETVEVTGLSKGVYFVTLTSTAGTTTKTFIVK